MVVGMGWGDNRGNRKQTRVNQRCGGRPGRRWVRGNCDQNLRYEKTLLKINGDRR